MPSLKPNRLRGVAWLVEVDEVRPKPSWAQRIADGAEGDPGEVADRVHGDLRVVGAGLDAEVAVAARRVEVVGREVRQLAGAPGLAVGEAEAVLAVLLGTGVGPKPKVRVSPRGGRPSASPVSAGGASYGVGGADPPTGSPRGHLRGGRVHAWSSATRSSRGSRGDVERREVQPVLRRGDDAGLVPAVEGVARLGGRCGRSLAPSARGDGEPADAGRPDRERSGAGDAEESGGG